MLPKRIDTLLNEYGQVEIVHVTKEFPKKRRRIRDEPFYGAFAIITTREDEVVFQRQSYEQVDVSRSYWMVQGGGLERGESFEEAAAGEVHEETGFDILVTGL